MRFSANICLFEYWGRRQIKQTSLLLMLKPHFSLQKRINIIGAFLCIAENYLYLLWVLCCVWWLQAGKPHWPKRILKRVSFYLNLLTERIKVVVLFGWFLGYPLSLYSRKYERKRQSSLWIESFLWIVNYCCLRPNLY